MKDESIWIIETKGGESDSGSDDNIDKYAKKKFDALKEYARHHHINFGFVRNKNVDDVNNVSTFFDNVGTDKYKRVYAEVSRKKKDSGKKPSNVMQVEEKCHYIGSGMVIR